MAPTAEVEKTTLEVRTTAEPGKKVEEFRNYTDSSRQETVQRHYMLMRKNQTYAFNRSRTVP
jgi:flagellum-specific peptidoglycan hydrolase FlgJ